MRKLVWGIVFLIVAGLVVVIGMKISGQSSAGNKSAKETPAVPVALAKPEKRDLRNVRIFTGTLNAWSKFNVAPKVGGRLELLKGNIGSAINPGELLAQIEEIEFLQSAAQAAADLAVAQEQLKEAELTLQLKEREFTRQKELRENEIVSQAQLDTAQTAYNTNKVIFAMRQAEVKSRTTSLENSQLKLAYTKIYSDWQPANTRYVAERFVDESELVAPNQDLLTIVEIDRLKGIIHVIERDYPLLQVGQQAKITTDAYPEEIFTGKVINISQILESNTRQAYVELEIANQDLRLKPGMFIRAEIEFNRHKNATVIPRNALVKRGETYGVFVLDQSTADRSNPQKVLFRVKFIELTLGIYSEDVVEVLSPNLSDPVVTLGNHLLVDGMTVFEPQTRTAADSVSESSDGQNK